MSVRIFETNISAPNAIWNSVAMSGTGQYQVISASNSLPYLSSDYGKTWSVISATFAPDTGSLDIAISKSGQYITILCQNKIHISQNYGVTWSNPAPITGYLTPIYYGSISMSGNGQYQIITASTGPFGYGSFYISSNYGSNFTLDTYQQANAVNATISFTGQYITYLIQSGFIGISSNFGATKTNTIPFSGFFSGGLSMSDNGQYQAVLMNSGYVGGAGPGYLYSNNFGASWSSVNTSISFITDINIGSSGQNWFLCGNNNISNLIAQSYNFGLTWTINQTSINILPTPIYYYVSISQSDNELFVTTANTNGITGNIVSGNLNQNNYFILNSPLDISLTEINVPGIGTYSSVICLSNNSITFTNKCLGLSAECLLIASGTPGFPGWGNSTGPFSSTGAGSGGSGGGHLYGNLRITNSNGSFPYNNTYDISVSKVPNLILTDPSWNTGSIGVQPTSLGSNKLYIYPATLNGNVPNGGNLQSGGPIYTLAGGTGGDGGDGVQFSTGRLAQDGSNADIGNTGLPGKYLFNQIGNIYIGGAGGGGGGSATNPTPEGTGGDSGSLGLGGIKGIPGGDGAGDSDGGNAIYNYTNAGAGGGGGGIPLDQTTFSDKGNPSQGLFFLQVFDPEPPIIAPISNDYFILSSNYDASISQVNIPGFGTYATAVCLSNNQIKFKPHAMCCSANLLIVGGGGGGFMGEVQKPSPAAPFFNSEGLAGGFGGGGGGGAAHFFGTSKITSLSGIFPYDQVYDISIGKGGVGGYIYPSTSVTDGGITSFGTNYFISAPSANGGNGGGEGTLLDPINGRALPGTQGSTINSGIFSQIAGCGNNGGNGGYGSIVYNAVGPPYVTGSHNGLPAGNGNTGNPGQYNIPTYGNIYVSGGGAGGDVSANQPGGVNWAALPGKGGNAGQGTGGIGFGPGANSGNGFSDSIGKFGIKNFYYAGGGGGGGGAPYYDISFLDPSGIATAMGGDGADGMFLIQVFDPLPPPPLPLLPNPPPPPPPIVSTLTTDLFYFNVNQYAYTQQITLPNKDVLAFGICLSNNTIVFTNEALDCQATMLLVGGGGGGGGGYNSRFPGGGGGGGGGGQLYGTSTITSVGGTLPINTFIDISLGIGGIPGRGPYQGTAGGISVFGSNYYGYNFAPKVSGGGPGGATIDNSCNGGISGGILTTGPFVNIGGSGSGGSGGDGYKCWTSVIAATNGNNSSTTNYNFQNYGIIVTGGGGGGGGGQGGPFCLVDISAGFGGDAGIGTGGLAGLAGGNGLSDSIGENALFNYFYAGSGGGGGGLPNSNQLQYDVSGGYGGGGLFAIMVLKQYVPPPPSPCPCPVVYKPLVTGVNNPKTFPGNRYSQYVRSSLGRPGYQRPAYGNRQLSPFGYWQGAPSGYGQPPRNSFV